MKNFIVLDAYFQKYKYYNKGLGIQDSISGLSTKNFEELMSKEKKTEIDEYIIDAQKSNFWKNVH